MKDLDKDQFKFVLLSIAISFGLGGSSTMMYFSVIGYPNQKLKWEQEYQKHHPKNTTPTPSTFSNAPTEAIIVE